MESLQFCEHWKLEELSPQAFKPAQALWYSLRSPLTQNYQHFTLERASCQTYCLPHTPSRISVLGLCQCEAFVTSMFETLCRYFLRQTVIGTHECLNISVYRFSGSRRWRFLMAKNLLSASNWCYNELAQQCAAFDLPFQTKGNGEPGMYPTSAKTWNYYYCWMRSRTLQRLYSSEIISALKIFRTTGFGLH